MNNVPQFNPFSALNGGSKNNVGLPFQIDVGSLDMMYHQIRLLIRKLLEQISQIYNRLHIIFPVHQHSDSIFRMLCPVQLCSVKNFSYVQCMFDTHSKMFATSNHASANSGSANKDHGGSGNGKSVDSGRSNGQAGSGGINNKGNGIKGINGLNKNNLVNGLTKLSSLNKANFSNAVNAMNIKNYYNQGSQKDEIMYGIGKVKKATNVRSRGLEKQIAMSILSEIEHGKIVTKNIVMEKARQLGKSSNFKACSRWCDHFLNRNPSIKQHVYRKTPTIAEFMKMEMPMQVPTTNMAEGVRKMQIKMSKRNNYMESNADRQWVRPQEWKEDEVDEEEREESQYTVFYDDQDQQSNQKDGDLHANQEDKNGEHFENEDYEAANNQKREY